MNDQRPYRDLTKRKDRESSLPPAKRPPPPRTTVPASKTSKPETGSKVTEPMTSSNKLLAGYMAFEFLTKGTLLGHKLDTDRAETTTFNGSESCEQYEQITSLLMMKTNGEDRIIPGVVNPTELRQWIEM